MLDSTRSASSVPCLSSRTSNLSDLFRSARQIAGRTVASLAACFVLLIAPAGRAQTTFTGGGMSFTTSDTAAVTSTISVSGASGTVKAVSVELDGVKSAGTCTADGSFCYFSLQSAEFLLKAPNGDEFVLLSSTGDGQDGCDGNPSQTASCNGLQGTSGDIITITDTASNAAPYDNPWLTTAMPYTVKPSSYYYNNFGDAPPLPGGDVAGDFPQTDGCGNPTGNPSLLCSAQTLNVAFLDAGANGSWTLYLIDNDTAFGAPDPVSITGWKLTLTYNSGGAVSTTTVLSSSANPASYPNSASSAPVTFTATITASSGTPTGTVAFTANGSTISGCGAVALSGGVAHCTTSLAQGNNSISAAYAGVAGTFGASSDSTTELVEVTAANTSGDTWCNNSPISDPIGGNPGLAYPSVIKIPSTAYPGKTVADVSVELEGVAGPVNGIAGQFMLVAPGGANNLDFLDSGFSFSGVTSAVNLTIEDSAGGYVPTTSAPASGTYLPTDDNEGENPDTFPASTSPAFDLSIPQVPATINFAPPYGTDNTHYTHNGVLTLGEAFNGSPANGDWALYSINGESLNLNNGWCLALTLNTGVTTTTTVTSGQNPQATGQPVTITATVASAGSPVPAGGTVTFTDTTSSTPVTLASAVPVNGSGQAAFTTSSLTEGDHQITANFSGTSTDNASFGSIWQRINTATTVTNISSTTWQFCNPGPVEIQGGSLAGPFTPNPSVISVTNLPGTLNTVGVQLTNFSVLTADDLDQLASLVEGPVPGGSTTGPALDFFSNTTQGDLTGTGEATLGNYIFEDSASGLVTSSLEDIAPGSYKPTAYLSYLNTPDVFTSSASGLYPAPAAGAFSYAPSHGASTFADVFTNGSNANGTWALFFSSGFPNATLGAAKGWCVNLTENLPAVSVDASHNGSFTQGEQNAQLTVGITNDGPGSTGDPAGGTNPMTVTDTLASAFTYAGFSGTGWSCSAAGQTVTCTNDSAIAEGGGYPTLRIEVNVSATANGSIDNTATATGAGVSSTSSNTDLIAIVPAPVLSVTKTHTGTFTQGTTAVWEMTVNNTASGSTTSGTVTVSDTLPSGYSLASFTGSGWTCGGTTAVTCTSNQTESGGSSFPAIMLSVNVPANSPTSVSNTALAYGGGDLAHTSLATAAASNTDTVTVVQVPASITVNAGDSPQATPISTAFTNPLAVTINDAAGIAISGSTVTFTAPAAGASGIFSNSSNTITVTTNSSGIASASFKANTNPGNYSVTAAVTGLSAATFSLSNLAPPAVVGISPTSGPTAGGTSVTITGANFTGATAVRFGTTSANNITAVNSTTITATSPAGTGTVDVTVTTPGGTSATSAADQFTYAAPPTVTSVFPASGPIAGGTSVTITGTNFTGATTVNFGTIAGTNVTLISPTQILVNSPAEAAGTVNVTVKTVGGTSTTTLADQFTYAASPTVIGVSPSSGPAHGGTQVVIAGTTLTGATAVYFGATPATSFSVVSSAMITAVTPPGTPGIVDVTVTTTGGTTTTSAADQFTYIGPPQITAITPSSGPTAGGTPVTITGTDLSPETGVYFGATFAPVTSGNSTQIILTSPAGAPGAVNVVVTTPAGSSQISPAYQFTYVAQPVVAALSPSIGATTGGTSVTLTGAGFTGATAVNFGSMPAVSFTVLSATQIAATSPAESAGTVDVTVTTVGGTSTTSPADQFSYVAPVATSLAPSVTPSSTFVYGQQPSISVALSPFNATGIAAGNFTATLDASASLTVSAGSATNSFSIALPATPLTVGPHTIAFTFTGTPFYLASSASITLTVTTPNLVVTTNQDDAGDAGFCTAQTTPGTGADTSCSLRDALLDAGSAGAANISFDSTFFAAAQTITLGSAGALNIPSNTTITGPVAGSGATLKNLVTVSGGGSSSDFSVFSVNFGVTGAAIANLTITNGNSSSGGGGINNYGALTVTNSTFSSNSGKNGGGIGNQGALTVTGSTFSNNSAIYGGGIDGASSVSLTVNDSTFSGNAAVYSGGGIYSGNTGPLMVNDSTFSNNTAAMGGGIYNDGTLTVTSSTLFDNSATANPGFGGGIYNNNALTLTNSILSGNSGQNGAGVGNNGGMTVTASYNVFYNNLDPGNSEDDCNNCTTNSNATTGDPKILLLADNGGPTQTMIPLPGSAAICAGLKANIPSGVTTDQRGEPNINTTYPGYNTTNPCVDAGAVQTDYSIAFVQQPSTVVQNAAMLPAPTVQLYESTVAFGDGTDSITIPLSLTTGSGALTGASTGTSATTGIAAYSGLSVSLPGTGDVLTAKLTLNSMSSPALAISVASNQFNVNSAVTQLAFIASPPATVTAGGNTGMVTVDEESVAGTLVTTGSDTITLTVTGPGSYSKTYTATATGGVAEFDLSSAALTIAGSYSYTATISGNDSVTAANASETVSAASPASVTTVSGTPQTAVIGAAFTAPLKVVVVDQYGNPVSGAAVSFASPVSGASATFTGLPATTATDGTASVTATANGTAGTTAYTVTASVSGAGTAASFLLTNTPVSTTLTVTASPTAIAYGQPVTISAAIAPPSVLTSSPTGTVTFYDGATALMPVSTVASASASYLVSVPTVGSHSYAAQYGGDTNFSAGALTNATSPLVVSKANATLTGPVSTVNMTYGAGGSITISVSGHFSGTGIATPGGSVSYTIGSGTAQTAAIASGAATLTVPANQAAGSYTVAVSYLGDGNYNPATPITVNLAIAEATLTIATNNATKVYGTANPAFTGTMTGALNGDNFTETFSTGATLSSAVGAYAIVPSVTGTNLADYTESITNGTLTVTEAATATSLSTNSATITPGQSVTLTAQVASTTSGTPSGSVNFFDNGMLLNAATLTGGTATYTTASLASGITHTITATYSGDTNFTSSSSTSSITVTVAPLDFTMTVVGPASGTVAPGSAISYKLSVTPGFSSYAGTVTFAVSGLPPGATASFSPSSIAADGGPQTITVTIQTAATTAAQHGTPAQAGRHMTSFALALLLLFGARGLRRNRRAMRRIFCVAVLLAGGAAAAVLSGCGSTSGFFAHPPHSYTIAITATSDNLQHTANVTLNLQ